MQIAASGYRTKRAGFLRWIFGNVRRPDAMLEGGWYGFTYHSIYGTKKKNVGDKRVAGFGIDVKLV